MFAFALRVFAGRRFLAARQAAQLRGCSRPDGRLAQAGE